MAPGNGAPQWMENNVLTRLLSQKDVQALLDMPLAVREVERAFRAHGEGRVSMPHKVYLNLPKVEGDFRAMPAALEGAAGLKWVNSHPQNPSRFGLPTVMAMCILSDPETALPLAVMDATQLTAYRTGAAGAVASKFLAPPDAASLGLVGCGVQARYLLEAHRVVFPGIEDVRVCDVSEERAQAFADAHGVRATPVEEVCQADIICTATPGRSIAVKRSFLRPGVLINAMGADAPGKQELESVVVQNATVVVDDIEQAAPSGEINVPIREGLFRAEEVQSTLGECVASASAMQQRKDVTVFDSTGLAVQDLVLAEALFLRAKERESGTTFAFTDEVRR